MSTSRTPEYPVASLLVKGSKGDEVAFSRIELVEVDGSLDSLPEKVLAQRRVVRRDESESISLWLPCKCSDGIFDLDSLDGNSLLSHSE